MHKVAPQIEQAINTPLLNIADATAEIIVKKHMKTVGLLGTAFTMEQDFLHGQVKAGLWFKSFDSNSCR